MKSVPRSSAPMTVAEIIDRHPLSGLQIRALVLCFFVVLVDGYDLAAIGYVAPALHRPGA